MKRFAIVITVLSFLFVACISEVPVKEVRTCSNVVKVELVIRSYSPGIISAPSENLMVKLTLENGKYVYNDSWKYIKWDRNNNLLKTATRMEMGQEYCFTEYEPIK